VAGAGAEVVLLAGGTGGARLARGMLDVVGDDLVVIANTGDDVEIHGGHVSPDPDLVLYTLADRIDARGWGLQDDTFTVMDGLRELGEDVWFNLGDRDLAVCLQRARRLGEGAALSETLAELASALGVRARVVPPSDDPVRTRVRAEGRWWAFQEFMIRVLPRGAAIEDVSFAGAPVARALPAAVDAVRDARAIVIGPSNPIISIGPILAVPGIREALEARAGPAVAVSPIVGGGVVKGPTAEFMAWAGLPANAGGVARVYEGLLDGIVADEPVEGLPALRIDTLMDGPDGRRRVAGETLEFTKSLRV
jgi:LPPG:FO 2-phospho-L-lactate transferase